MTDLGTGDPASTRPSSPRQHARRLLLMLALDASGSTVDYLPQLQSALDSWLPGLRASRELAGVIDLAVLTFGGAGVHWLDPRTGRPGEAPVAAPLGQWSTPQLAPGGHTPLGQALEEALAFHEAWKQAARLQRPYMPVLWIVTDGVPCDPGRVPDTRWRRHVPVLRERERNGHLAVFVARPAVFETSTLDDLAPGATVPLEMDLPLLLNLISISVRSTRDGSDAAARVRQAMADLGLTEA